MSFIGLSCYPFRRHPRIFRARRSLQNMKEIEADGLLNFHSAALDPVFSDILHPDIAALPEIVHVLLLRSEQLLEPLYHHAIHRPLGAAAEFFCGSSCRGMIDHELGEI